MMEQRGILLAGKKISFILVSLLLTQTLAIAQMLELSGTVISDNEKYITSRFMGFIKSVNVNDGSRVKKGDLLYEIDSIEIDSKKQQATLAVQMYENQYINVKRNFERFSRLYEKGLVSKFEVEQLELGAKNLENMVNISKLQLQEVNNQYQYLKIVAPNDGVVIKKMVKAGEMAIPGMPAIVLSDLASLKISTEVAESDLKNIQVDQSVDIEIPSINFTTKGSISAIIPSSNPMTHTFTIKIRFESSNEVFPGMYTKVTIK